MRSISNSQILQKIIKKTINPSQELLSKKNIQNLAEQVVFVKELFRSHILLLEMTKFSPKKSFYDLRRLNFYKDNTISGYQKSIMFLREKVLTFGEKNPSVKIIISEPDSKYLALVVDLNGKLKVWYREGKEIIRYLESFVVSVY